MSRSLGVDFGTTRVGLAISDPLGLTARPLSVVPRSVVLDEVVNLVKEQDIGTIVVGLPTGLSGGEGVSATEARKLAEEIRTVTGVDVVMVDERFTSRLAEVALLESGMKRRKRRETVDKVAAAIILQDYLDRNQ
ncbi:MAG TPA: Holliday junction resolvase RuvX [Acidimicrobiia bacterium]|nr:Holliday junction resolvase RuvX [Acidimicrobiia bacterium]